MFRPTKHAKKSVSLAYVIAVLGMLYLMIPRLPRFMWNQSGAFMILWIGFALLVMGANLWFLVGADKERRASRSKTFLPVRQVVATPGEGERPKQKRQMRG
ncbi:cbb3-type cytochrome c oxidase subunit I [Sulfoacidibacillus ferrooxidans]|uniref:Uncharacterized protein n=1 Tax=Sulfoacidibacillus ferrooxidans TaxID=2005001 RepID=A0A9X1V6C9_9BACL|nr:cbb3-type cytochrome c oxidase subunit I [Sulfoacidibacillus ferrooxidans]MCI0182461.1 hypothetical protein [Sulfoacidibacillus ferrooxidans]